MISLSVIVIREEGERFVRRESDAESGDSE